ncbi:hypothetical protein L596_027014 [Steinernema carpocapsae]|uniref:Uncharacterized protein n=1 Tax=Steinernema carpocapsae TaxID=34508 RepID=A0A4U5M354_STECR|nr:hypothetical protein L596_027014 [Steinernema carpocapsae]
MTDTVLGYGGIYTTQTENFKKIAWRSITAEIQKGKNRLLPLGPIKSQQVDSYVRRKIEYYVEYIINRCKGGRPVDSSIRYG